MKKNTTPMEQFQSPI